MRGLGEILLLACDSTMQTAVVLAAFVEALRFNRVIYRCCRYVSTYEITLVVTCSRRSCCSYTNICFGVEDYHFYCVRVDKLLYAQHTWDITW